MQLQNTTCMTCHRLRGDTTWNTNLFNFSWNCTTILFRIKCYNHIHTVWKLWKLFLTTLYDKNFVKTTASLKKLLKSWFHEIFFRFFIHSVEKRDNLSPHWNLFPRNQFVINFFSKTGAFTKVLSKRRESKFPKFPQCVS